MSAYNSNCLSCSASGPDCLDCPAGLMQNRTIAEINSFSAMPKSAIGAFSQWAGLATALIGAIGTIGGSAITAALAPHVQAATGTGTTAAPTTVIQAPAAAATNYTPWIIGGVVALGGLMLAMNMRNNNDRRR